MTIGKKYIRDKAIKNWGEGWRPWKGGNFEGKLGEVLLGKIEKIFKRCHYMKKKEEESRNYKLP